MKSHFTLRRRFMSALAAFAALPSARANAGPPLIEVWKAPTCGCCKDWVRHLEANGFRTQVNESGNSAMRARLGIDMQFGSCHTALAGRYALPLEIAPPLLADLAQAIAVYKLHPYAADPKIEQDYKDALAALVRIGQGVIRLPIAGIEPVSGGASGVVAIDRERPLTPESMAGFI